VIGVVAYGSGNVAAIENVLAQLGRPSVRVTGANDFAGVEKLILPGVGAFDTVISRLRESDLYAPLEDAVMGRKTPVLGICVGMQILADGSEEGSEPGLGWIPGRVTKIDVTGLNRKPYLPHMGWNSVWAAGSNPLFKGVDLTFGFYFLHSYRFECAQPESEIATANYGGEFTVAVGRDNVFGVQFHPEKSHSNGVRLISNFATI